MAISKMLEYTIYSLEGHIKGKKEVSIHISNCKGTYIIHRALIKQLDEKRQGSANCKTRSEVKGGGKKPWKQKGTGKARAGSIRSPLWRGGGIIFGPQTKQYNKKINRKERKLALNTLICNKINNTILVDAINVKIEKPSTKLIIQMLSILNINIRENILIILSNVNYNLYLSTRNLHNVKVKAVNQINVFNILQANTVLIELGALDKIQKLYYN